MEFIDMYVNILASIIAMLLMLGIVVLLAIIIAIIIVTGYKKIKEIIKRGWQRVDNVQPLYYNIIKQKAGNNKGEQTMYKETFNCKCGRVVYGIDCK